MSAVNKHYPFLMKFTKIHKVYGSIEETLPIVSVESGHDWVKSVNKNKNLDYSVPGSYEIIPNPDFYA